MNRLSLHLCHEEQLADLVPSARERYERAVTVYHNLWDALWTDIDTEFGGLVTLRVGENMLACQEGVEWSTLFHGLAYDLAAALRHFSRGGDWAVVPLRQQSLLWAEVIIQRSRDTGWVTVQYHECVGRETAEKVPFVWSDFEHEVRREVTRYTDNLTRAIRATPELRDVDLRSVFSYCWMI